MPAYPNTMLVEGELDPVNGGQGQQRLDFEVRGYIDAQIRELERRALEQGQLGYPIRRVKVAQAVLVGDVLVNVLASIEPDYTIKPVSAVTYDPDTTPWCGVAVDAASAFQTVRIVPFGVGIPSTITRLVSGNAGELTFDTSSNRLRLRLIGEPLVGWVNDKGYAQLLPRAEG